MSVRESCKALDAGISAEFSWDVAYQSSNAANWELLPLADLRDFLVGSGVDLSQVTSALDIGCGRGLRAFVALLGIPSFNRPEFSWTGIDVSGSAIATATEIASRLRQSADRDFPFRGQIASFLGGQIPTQLNAQVEFHRQDLFAIGAKEDSRFDLLVDWMCFHNLDPAQRETYARFVSARCRKYFVLKAFCFEMSSVVLLNEAVPGVQKQLISVEDVKRTFGADFEIVHMFDDREDLNPDPPHSDGMIAAKRAYFLVRKSA